MYIIEYNIMYLVYTATPAVCDSRNGILCERWGNEYNVETRSMVKTKIMLEGIVQRYLHDYFRKRCTESYGGPHRRRARPVVIAIKDEKTRNSLQLLLADCRR